MRFKKFLCYILCGVLTFGVISTANYKSAHAMEWVSGALSFAETLTWVLASLGITCTVSDYATEVDKSRSEFWEDYEQEFYDYVNEHNGNTASDRFIEWKNKLCKGVLDKSSEYWSLFKSWASSLVNGSSSGGGSSSGSFEYGGTFELIDFFNSLNIMPSNIDSFNNVVLESPFAIHFYNNGVFYCYILSDNQYDFIYQNGYLNIYPYNNYLGYVYTSSGTGIATSNFNPNLRININSNNDYFLYGYNSSTSLPSNCYNWDGLSGTSSDTNFDSVTTNVDDLDVISSDGVDEDSPEVTLPYPGVSDSDDTISSDAYQDIIDAINDGTISQEDGIIQIQELLRIITYDTVTDDVVPPIKDDDGNNKKKDDVLKENKENAGFSLGGLEAVFPFCIPFDIYAFMTLLVADPVAPEFVFPIQSVNGQEEEIHIDLSPFEPVAVVVRYCFDFLFIIGLGLITRQLIGAGGGD